MGATKGGVGKTTLATNLAAYQAIQGRDVLIMDCDGQASASHWCAMREDNDTARKLPVVQQFGASVRPALADLRRRYDLVIVDVGARDSVELRQAATVADAMLAPICPSQFDVWTLARLAELVTDAGDFRKSPLRPWVVCTRASSHWRVNEADDAQEALREFDELEYAGIIRERVAYRRCVRKGLSVFEDDPRDAQAIRELEQAFKKLQNG